MATLGLGSLAGGMIGSSSNATYSPSGSSQPSSLPFQGQQDPSQANPQEQGLPTETPAAPELLNLTSQINALLQLLSTTYPAYQPYVEGAQEILVQGLVEVASGMETRGSEVGQPQIV